MKFIIPVSMLIILILAQSVSAESISTEEKCLHWDLYENCYNLGAGYSWCQETKVDFSKSSENSLNENEKSIKVYSFCYNGDLIAKTTVHSSFNSNSKGTSIEKSFFSPNIEEILYLIYIPDYTLKFVNGEFKFVRGMPPLCLGDFC